MSSFVIDATDLFFETDNGILYTGHGWWLDEGEPTTDKGFI